MSTLVYGLPYYNYSYAHNHLKHDQLCITLLPCLLTVEVRKKRLLDRHVTCCFLFYYQAFPDIPEIHPVQEQVDDNVSFTVGIKGDYRKLPHPSVSPTPTSCRGQPVERAIFDDNEVQ